MCKVVSTEYRLHESKVASRRSACQEISPPSKCIASSATADTSYVRLAALGRFTKQIRQKNIQIYGKHFLCKNAAIRNCYSSVICCEIILNYFILNKYIQEHLQSSKIFFTYLKVSKSAVSNIEIGSYKYWWIYKEQMHLDIKERKCLCNRSFGWTSLLGKRKRVLEINKFRKNC